MSQTIQLGRRFFLSAAAVTGGGFSLGWSLPAAAQKAGVRSRLWGEMIEG